MSGRGVYPERSEGRPTEDRNRKPFSLLAFLVSWHGSGRFTIYDLQNYRAEGAAVQQWCNQGWREGSRYYQVVMVVVWPAAYNHQPS